jgi:protein phosphatase methylesterase 1
MSDLQRAWARKKLQTMATVDNAFDEQEEDGAVAELPDAFDDSSSASSASSTGTVIPSPTRHLFARPQA